MFDKKNRPRVLRRNFALLREGVATRKWKRGAKAKADAAAALSLQRRTFRSLRQGVAVAAASRAQRARADAFVAHKLVTRGWENLRDHPAEKKVRKTMVMQVVSAECFDRGAAIGGPKNGRKTTAGTAITTACETSLLKEAFYSTRWPGGVSITRSSYRQ